MDIFKGWKKKKTRYHCIIMLPIDPMRKRVLARLRNLRGPGATRKYSAPKMLLIWLPKIVLTFKASPWHYLVQRSPF